VLPGSVIKQVVESHGDEGEKVLKKTMNWKACAIRHAGASINLFKILNVRQMTIALHTIVFTLTTNNLADFLELGRRILDISN